METGFTLSLLDRLPPVSAQEIILQAALEAEDSGVQSLRLTLDSLRSSDVGSE